MVQPTLPERCPHLGGLLRLRAAPGREALDLILDLEHARLHVLHDAGASSWEGRVALGPRQAAPWAMRLQDLPATREPGAQPPFQLWWRLGERWGTRGLGVLPPHPVTPLQAVAVDLFRQAFTLAVDHPRAAQALSRWNADLRLIATVALHEGRPRRVQLLGMVDEPGVRTLEALQAVLPDRAALLVDAHTCASLGSWDPSGLVAAHPVAWVGARPGVRDRLRDQGVPDEAFHGSLETARTWLRQG